ncbi:L10-interacting MYB domain-containing protein-like isoform X2 [Impatiens glandulifera]|uniref:L10-interacting MYB domain-containing protein-like isoform X2 n=1 Tax=Impatiens glandulifera TaxID=253017 RepID=UPI001FB1901A|nr:L10-interacting MYB domain-containing protein-like isoform X2 [Impatiens glandulifera]
MLFDGLPFSGTSNAQMDSESKQERLRTRWTPALDKVFADLVVEQFQEGNRTNTVFDKKTWTRIRDEFNKRTDLNFNNKQLRKHLDVLRMRYDSVKSSFMRNNFVLEDATSVGFDLWDDLGAQPKPGGSTKIKDCPIYEQLCLIFADSGADGKYAQSSHFEDLEKLTANGDSCQENGTPVSKNLPLIKYEPGSTCAVQSIMKIVLDRKRKRLSENGYSSEQTKKNGETYGSMAKAMMDMVAASKSIPVAMAKKQESKFSITNCVKLLDEMEGVEPPLYFAALDLFEDPVLRETFLSLNSNILRLNWVRAKCYHHHRFTTNLWK